MSEFFKNGEEKQYIAPDYDGHPEDDTEEPADIDEAIVDTEDEGKVEQLIDDINNEEKEEKKVVTSPFGGPTTSPSPSSTPAWSPTPSFGGGSTPAFGGGSGTSPWGQRSSGWGSPSGGSMWNGGQPKTENKEINREKKVIFCDFLDCIVETWDSQGRPGYLPRDIYDLKPRFEVWGKLQAFNPELVYSMIPINLIPSTNGAQGWLKTLEYFCYGLSSWLRIPYDHCKVLAQTAIGQPKEDLINSILMGGPTRVEAKDAIYVGIYSGLAGQSNRDQLAATNCGIDYIDLGILLNNMY
jgi:hypothetical protein